MEQDLPAAAAAPERAAARSSRFLLLVVFLAGVGTLGVEMIASRLLAPYFGTSQPIWAVVIGLTLIYLSIGYRLGGRLADRSPDERLFYRIICWAGLATGLIPLLSDPILRFSQQALRSFAVGGFLGALLGVLVLFAAPVILMAMVSPFALRLEMKRVEAGIGGVGTAAGSISAISTIGSIVGTFLTTLFLIPAIGTARTTYLFAAFLIVLGLIGLRDWRYLLMLGAVVALAAYTLTARGNIKSADCRACALVYEEESAYNYIQVATRQTQRGPTVNLILNEGQAIHSVYNLTYRTTGNPVDLLTGGGPWDYWSITPYFYPERDPSSVGSLLMLGSATGTLPKQFLAIYGADARVDAVEIDPRIIAVGRDYFDMDDAAVAPEKHPNYHVHAADARQWMATHQGSYDIIAMDAYHQPYIPFHLTTVEFFALARSRLAPDGVVAVNAGKGPGGDERLGQALANTMRQVFPQVFIIEAATFGNQIIVGVNRPVGDGVQNFVRNYARMEVPALRAVMDWSIRLGEQPLREFEPRADLRPFTDDWAPVENLIDSLIFDAVLK